MMRDVVLTFFKSEGIEVVKEEGSVLHLAFTGETARFRGIASVDENISVLSFYSLCPVAVPKQHMTRALELVSRLNFGHMLGNLELDVDSGQIRFKTSLDVEGEELTEGLVANLVYANIASMEQMLPAIRAVIVDEMNIGDAIRTLMS